MATSVYTVYRLLLQTLDDVSLPTDDKVLHSIPLLICLSFTFPSLLQTCSRRVHVRLTSLSVEDVDECVSGKVVIF